MRNHRLLRGVRLLLMGLLAAAIGTTAHARTPVIVAAEPWEHLLYLDADKKPAGLISRFVDRMNAVQGRFQFALIVVPRLRLNRYFIDQQADVYPLRTVDWTEPELRLRATKTIVIAHDVYFTQSGDKRRVESVCAHISENHIVAVSGYHYQVFGNNSDPNYIAQHFRADLLPSNDSVVRFVLMGRANVGIAPEAILANYLSDPTIRTRLEVCEHPDSEVGLSNLVREGGPISVEEMNAIIDALEESGDLKRLRVEMAIPKAKAE